MKENVRKLKKKENGITLVALIVTIVVLLILAGITLTYVLGDNSVFKQALDAKVEIKKAKYEEVLRTIEIGLQPERKLNNWTNQKYMDEFEEKIREEYIFADAKEISQLSYTEEITIQVITKEGWVYWITEENIEYKGLEEELPPAEPEVETTGIFAVLKSDGTLEFYTTKEKADKVAGKHYDNMQGEVIERNAGELTTNAPWFQDKENITSVRFADEVAPEYLGYYFSDLTELVNVDMSKVKIHNVTDMEGLFYNCGKLQSINTQGWVTKNVTNMEAMFINCSSLTSLDVSMFDTSNVTNMKNMFHGLALTNIDVSSFDTSNVTNMQGMFANSKNLQQLDLSNFDTRNVTNMVNMFYGCNNLTNLDLSSFDTSNVTNMGSMFWGCNQLTSLDVSGFDTGNVTTMQGMFVACKQLTSLDVSGFDTSNVENMKRMFMDCHQLTSLDTSKFNTQNVMDMSYMFDHCLQITNIDVSNFDTQNVINMKQMFNQCSEIANIDLSRFNTSKVTDMSYMFNQCGKLQELDLSSFNTKSVTTMEYMFNGNTSLKNIYVGKDWVINSGTIQTKMFSGCGTDRVTTKQ